MNRQKIYRFDRFGQIGKKSVNRVIFPKNVLNDVGNLKNVFNQVFGRFTDLPNRVIFGKNDNFKLFIHLKCTKRSPKLYTYSRRAKPAGNDSMARSETRPPFASEVSR